jgi:periplasmic protein TonB
VDFLEQLEQGRYGSFELKKLVGPNLMRGLVISVLIHSVVIASPYIVKLFQSEDNIPPPPLRVVDMSELTKLKSNQNTEAPPTIEAPKMAAPKAAIPVAVEEDIVEKDQPMIASQAEIAKSVAAAPGEGLDLGKGGDVIIKDEASNSDEIPDASKFIPFEVPPQQLANCPQPAFPDLAKTAGVAGKVQVQIYVDKTGTVKKWKIVKVDPKGLGFEEEVEKVLPKWKFTPAIQQGSPVGVWISMPFKFSYKKQ